MRYGTRSSFKRRWTPLGHRPECRVKIAYEFGYLYAAICPFSGDLFALLLPSMKKECFKIFVEQFERHLVRQPTEPEPEAGAERAETLLIVDGAGSHQESVLSANSRLRLEKLPAACPELNPVERFFQELRKELANEIFESVTAIEEKIQELLKRYWESPQLLVQLTNYPYINTSHSN